MASPLSVMSVVPFLKSVGLCPYPVIIHCVTCLVVQCQPIAYCVVHDYHYQDMQTSVFIYYCAEECDTATTSIVPSWRYMYA